MLFNYQKVSTWTDDDRDVVLTLVLAGEVDDVLLLGDGVVEWSLTGEMSRRMKLKDYVIKLFKILICLLFFKLSYVVKGLVICKQYHSDLDYSRASQFISGKVTV